MRSSRPHLRSQTGVRRRRLRLVGGAAVLVAALSGGLDPAHAYTQSEACSSVVGVALERTAFTPSAVAASAWAVVHPMKTLPQDTSTQLEMASGGVGGADASTLFVLGSLSKPLTAAGVMLLVDRGELRLHDPVRDHIPDFRPQDISPITVEHLLTHTSGFSAEAGQEARLDRSLSIEDRAILASTAERGTAQFVYSNLNYAILGALIEEVSGESFAVFMKREVFAPLGMDSTSASTNRAQDIAASGNRMLYGFPVRAVEQVPIGAAPDGYTVSTARDMGRFLRMLLNEGVGDDGARVLSEASARAMLVEHAVTPEHAVAPGTRGYGYGWGTGGAADRPTAAHVGRTDGFFSHAFLSPADRSAVVVLQAVNGPLYDQTAPVTQFATTIDQHAAGGLGSLGGTSGAGESGAVTAVLFVGIGVVSLGAVALVSALRSRRDRRRSPHSASSRRRRVTRCALDLGGAVGVVTCWQLAVGLLLNGGLALTSDPFAISPELTLTAWVLAILLLVRCIGTVARSCSQLACAPKLRTHRHRVQEAV